MRLWRWLRREIFPFERREIRSRDEVDLYLTRQFLLGHTLTRVALMLHTMHQPDDDPCHHDHPWSFFTLILSGGYWEEITVPDTREDPNGTVRIGRHRIIAPGREPGTVIIRRWNGPGRIRFNRAEHTHRIDTLPAGQCRTLVLRFDKRRSWGFHTTQGFVPWRDFINMRGAFGVLWCGTDNHKGDTP